MSDNRFLQLLSKGVSNWNEWRLKNQKEHIDLVEVNLTDVYLAEINLTAADLTNADLSGANLSGANLKGADLIGVNLTGANLTGANLYRTNLDKSNLYGSVLIGANLSYAILKGANFHGANLSNANLTGSNLQYSNLVGTNIENAILTGGYIHGINVWDVNGKPEDQSNLIITSEDEAEISVDDLQVAQFVYLLLNNQNVRNVIDTITSKAVLIIGRFTSERKKILDLIREELHNHNYVPILFDCEKPENQSLLETVMTLAGMARFIIADVTAATMVREELRSIVEKYPSKPIQPILLDTEKQYVTLPEIISGFKSVLPVYQYSDQNEVSSQLKEAIINPVEEWLDTRKSQITNGFKTLREIELEQKNEELSRRIDALEKRKGAQ